MIEPISLNVFKTNDISISMFLSNCRLAFSFRSFSAFLSMMTSGQIY